MAKHKAAQHADIKPWLSAKADCKEGRFIQAGNSLLLSKEFQELSSGAALMYLCMTMECGGKKEFEFPKSAGSKYGFAYMTYRRYLEELKDKRFICCIEDNHTLRKSNVYAFLSEWKK